MRSVALTQENLENQIAVVQNEIRVNVLNRPYGGFPWLIDARRCCSTTFANSHNGYGDFVDLERRRSRTPSQFFDRYYAPGNAVLTVVGRRRPGAGPRLGRAALRRHPRARGPEAAVASPSRRSPSERRAVVHDRLAPAPAVALAWRVPDPADLDAYLPYVVLAEVLTDGDAARLQERLLLRGPHAPPASAATSGMLGDPLDARDPTPLLLEVHHPDETPADDRAGARRRGDRPARRRTGWPMTSSTARSRA